MVNRAPRRSWLIGFCIVMSSFYAFGPSFRAAAFRLIVASDTLHLRAICLMPIASSYFARFAARFLFALFWSSFACQSAG